jgi:hypothetical protein
MTAETLAAFTVLAAMLVALASVVAVTLLTGVAPQPTSPAARRLMVRALPANLRGPLYDLGSGWGGLAFAMARRCPDCAVVGFELSPLPWAVSRLRLLLQPTPNLRFRYGNFHNARLGNAALVVCFLGPGAMRRLQHKLAQELSPEAWVLSNFFRFPDWRAEREETVHDRHATRIYLYRIRGQTGPGMKYAGRL